MKTDHSHAIQTLRERAAGMQHRIDLYSVSSESFSAPDERQSAAMILATLEIQRTSLLASARALKGLTLEADGHKRSPLRAGVSNR